MNPPSSHVDTTALLLHAEESGVLDRLVPLIYEELRRMAHRQLARQWEGQTLETSELVHEAYLKLVGESQVTRRGRAYFFAAAGRAMRQVLVDRARRRGAAKRWGGQTALGLDEASIAVDDLAGELIELDGALDQLAVLSPRPARVVECRYFGGLSVEQTAEALRISPRTVKYDWAFARAWLYKALQAEAAG